jgi:hypothetical protein
MKPTRGIVAAIPTILTTAAAVLAALSLGAVAAPAHPLNPAAPFDIAVPPAGSKAEPGKPPPVRTTPGIETEFSYEGGTISPDDAAARGLSCFTPQAGQTRCYTTRRQLADAEHIATPGENRAEARARAARKKRPGRHAHAANHYGSSAYPFQLTQHSDGTGWWVPTNSYCQWFDLPGSYGGNASWLDSGQHTAITATGYGGGGSTGGWPAWNSYDLSGYGWNDATFSRSRICI